MTKDEVASTLSNIALLLELKGENIFKTRAYRNGAETVLNPELDIVALAKSGELSEVKGIGSALQQKITELVQNGKLEFYENLRAEFPDSLFELFGISGLGPKKVKTLYDQLSIDSLEKLEAACHNGTISRLSGFGTKTVKNLLDSIAFKKKFSDRFRLGEISPLAITLRKKILDHPKVYQCEIAGSFRRAKETLHDIDFLVATDEPEELTTFFTQMSEVDKVIAQGPSKAQILLANGLQCDLRAVSTREFPFALQYFSGSKEHNIAVRSRAKSYGLSLNEYGFTALDISAKAPECQTEKEIYKALELDWIPPELRENRGEIEAAANGSLPRLVEMENLKGAFHNHTSASDGTHSLLEMARAAQDIGLQYLGIADHSKSSFQANGLYPERLLKQVKEIKRLNQQWQNFELLAGSEVDILKDGSLDFEDSILSQLDYVVASVHSSFTLDQETMTARIIKAMENPYVTMIGHLTGRLLLKRAPYLVDHKKIIDCAAETHTAIELNANYHRLDMDWRWWKLARDKGVKCAINPDAHHTDHLQFLHYGVKIARKGWLRSEDVLNCMDLGEIKEFLERPKIKKNPS